MGFNEMRSEQMARALTSGSAPAPSRVVSMSQREAEDHQPCRFEVCVSIRSRGAKVPQLSPLWDEVIYVEADDCPFTSWESEERRGLSERDANRIVEFVNRHRACRIYVHCFVGASRSVSVAAAIRAGLGLPAGLEQIPNPLAYNRMIAAFQLAIDTRLQAEAEASADA